MQYTTAIVLAITGFATAQSTSTSNAATPSISGSQSGCGQSIDAFITKCLLSATGMVAACDWLDYDCLCDKQRYVLACHENCPSDPRRFRAEQTRISYCNAAKAYGTSSSTSISNSTVATTSGSNFSSETHSSSATYTDASATKADTSTSTAVVRSSASFANLAAAPAATDSDAGSKVVLPAGSFLAALFGLASML